MIGLHADELIRHRETTPRNEWYLWVTGHSNILKGMHRCPKNNLFERWPSVAQRSLWTSTIRQRCAPVEHLSSSTCTKTVGSVVTKQLDSMDHAASNALWVKKIWIEMCWRLSTSYSAHAVRWMETLAHIISVDPGDSNKQGCKPLLTRISVRDIPLGSCRHE